MPFNLAAAPAVKPTAHKLFLPLPADNPRRTPPAARIPLSAAELPAMPLGSHQESIDAAERCISYSKLLNLVIGIAADGACLGQLQLQTRDSSSVRACARAHVDLPI